MSPNDLKLSDGGAWHRLCRKVFGFFSTGCDARSGSLQRMVRPRCCGVNITHHSANGGAFIDGWTITAMGSRPMKEAEKILMLAFPGHEGSIAIPGTDLGSLIELAKRQNTSARKFVDLRWQDRGQPNLEP